MNDAIVAWAITLSGGNNNRASNNVVTNNQEGISVSAVSGNLLYNNTLYANGVGHSNQCCYEAIRLDGSVNTIIRNNIVFDNALNSIYTTGSIHTLASNNLLSDPKFVNSATNDFRLQAVSPAINAGAPLAEVTTDFAGTSRPQGAAYDIGAYEYSTGSPIPPPLPCDLNGDSAITVTDVQLCANQAIGASACTSAGDINKDSMCNVIDVQRVVNTVLGGACVTD
jgi:parallel beta-helix repeat protein